MKTNMMFKVHGRALMKVRPSVCLSELASRPRISISIQLDSSIHLKVMNKQKQVIQLTNQAGYKAMSRS